MDKIKGMYIWVTTHDVKTIKKELKKLGFVERKVDNPHYNIIYIRRNGNIFGYASKDWDIENKKLYRARDFFNIVAGADYGANVSFARLPREIVVNEKLGRVTAVFKDCIGYHTFRSEVNDKHDTFDKLTGVYIALIRAYMPEAKAKAIISNAFVYNRITERRALLLGALTSQLLTIGFSLHQVNKLVKLIKSGTSALFNIDGDEYVVDMKYKK